MKQVSNSIDFLFLSYSLRHSTKSQKVFSRHNGFFICSDANGIMLITNNNVITGGTGRLAGEPGNFKAHAIASIYAPAGGVTFDGRISY